MTQRRTAIAGTVLVVVADQATKLAAGPLAATGATHPVRNSGLSLQLVRTSRWGETALMALVLVAVSAVCLRGVHRGRLPPWTVALVVGGSLSNVVDRAWLGSVRDFLPVGPLALNVADVALVAGIAAAAAAHRRTASERR